MNQASSSKKKTSFFRKLLKVLSCFLLPEEASVCDDEEHVSHHHEVHEKEQQQQLPAEDVSHHEQQQRQQQEQLVIYVGGVDVDKKSRRSFHVPLKYASYATFRALLEQSGDKLETISARGSVVIHCKIAEFESKLNFVEALVKAKEREAIAQVMDARALRERRSGD